MFAGAMEKRLTHPQDTDDPVARDASNPKVRSRAQDTVEYGLIIATIALVVLLGVMTFGRLIEPWFASLAGRITTVGT